MVRTGNYLIFDLVTFESAAAAHGAGRGRARRRRTRLAWEEIR